VSYVRRGPNSSVYIFDAEDLGPACWNCGLADPDVHHFMTRDLERMLRHIDDHRAVGDRIPDDLDQLLRDEWESR
jgi:hypothetical protein